VLETTKHKVVLTEAIQAEWNKHQSLTALTWRSTMVAKKRVCWIDAPADDELRRKVERVDDEECEAILKKKQHFEKALAAIGQDKRQTMLGKIENIENMLRSYESIRDAMLKDIHLIEAALKADKIVVSMDEAVRRYFHEATQKVGELRLIVWVNPCESEETPLEWLKDGAELERDRLLGYQKENGNT
jgi:hypothetical protein